VDVALIGVAHPDTPTITSPSAVAGLEFTDPAAAVKAALPDVYAAGADLVVVLAHFGAEGGDFGLAGDLARALDPERVHLIVGGHTHRRATGVVNGIPILQPWPKSSAFGAVEFTIDGEGSVTGFSYPYSRTTYTSYFGEGWPRWRDREVVPLKRVAAMARKWERRVDAARRKVVGEVTAPVRRDYRRESAMGNWAADVLRETGADFGLTNSGGLRADLDAGEITFGEIYDVMPFDNRLVHVTITGAALLEVLELGVGGHHGVIQVAGLRFAFDYDRPGGARIVGDVIDTATGLPIVLDRSYVVAVPDFLAEGGDGFKPLTEGKHAKKDALVRDLMVDWLRANRPFDPPDPKTERRMVSTGKAP
jgi:5'-nucleotidase